MERQLDCEPQSPVIELVKRARSFLSFESVDSVAFSSSSDPSRSRIIRSICFVTRNPFLNSRVLMNILSTRGVLEQGACLDAFIAIMLDSPSNQMDFEECNGIEEVAMLIRDKQVDENLRLKCGEFLLLLIGHLNGRETPPMVTIHEDIRRFLGEKSASLICAASPFGSTLDPEERLTALHIQVRRVPGVS